MYPEVYPCENSNDRGVMTGKKKVDLSLVVESEKSELRCKTVSKVQELEGLPVMGGQGLKLKALYLERLKMLASMQHILKCGIRSQKGSSSEDSEGCVQTDTPKTCSSCSSISTMADAILFEEDAVITEFKQRTNGFIPTMS